MGSCFSKKKCSVSSSSPLPCLNQPSNQIVTTQVEKESEKKKNEMVVVAKDGGEGKKVEEERMKREDFEIQHQCSVSPNPKTGELGINCDSEYGGGGNGGVIDVVSLLSNVRTTSCTKEEIDAILIQCGRLSRSSSGKELGSTGIDRSGRKYSGSKRSYDFDTGNGESVDEINNCDNNKDDDGDEISRYRQWQRDQQRSRSASHGRRRTPSREREQQQRSGSRDRGTCSSTGRRLSRSPGRRSETTPIINAANSTSTSSIAVEKSISQANGSSTRPGKMVSVPASVSSLAMDKSNNGGGDANGNAAMRRFLVRKNSGTQSRSPSPANRCANNENCNQQQPSLSRSSSRKAEQSPYRRNPLSEIDNNSMAIAVQQPPNPQNPTKTAADTAAAFTAKVRTSRIRDTKEVKPNLEMNNVRRTNKSCKEGALENNFEQLQVCTELKGNTNSNKNNYAEVATIASGAEISKPRPRSSGRSRDHDFNPESVLNPTSSYNALLLEDIQNFHQKNTEAAVPLPSCLTKACSILEAVADLNSCATSSLSSACSGNGSSNTNENNNYNNNASEKRVEKTKGPKLESVVEPNNFHKYVTVKRGTSTMSWEDEVEDQESSGSNSFVTQQNWGFSSSNSSSLWEPNSVDSTDRWTNNSSRSSNTKEDSAEVERRGLSGNHQGKKNKVRRGRVAGSGGG